MARPFTILLLSLSQAGCMGGEKSVPPHVLESVDHDFSSNADRRTDPGYRPVSWALPVLRSTGKHWRIVGDDRPLAGWLGRTIVAEGRMVLDESGAYRTRFWLVKDHVGCLDPTHQDEIVGGIDVVLTSGVSVQVTDALIRVEGVLSLREQRGHPPQLILHATAVEPLPQPGEWLLPRFQ